MSALRRALTIVLLAASTVLAHAQAYTSIVVIGDSLSDTGNDTHLSTSAYTAAGAVPAPATGYTQGSFTDGVDTLPPATLYNGVWIKQLAATLAAKPSAVDSLDGGTNYAYGYAFTGTGTSALTYGPLNFSINVNSMGTQLQTYLATNPAITNKTLFVIWGGANDLLNATSAAAISTAATNELGIIRTLINAGATDFLVVNLPPLGAIPRLHGSGLEIAVTGYAAAFNQGLAAGLAALPGSFPAKSLHIYPLDVFTLFNTIIKNPSPYGFTNVTDMSQFAAVNPDQYLFWDGLHPTTAGHHQLALAAAALIAPGATTTTVASSSLTANLNASVTFTATVTSMTGTPTGTVTFYDGNTAIGTGQLSGANPNTATFTTTSLMAGPHSITAAYTASQYFNTSTSTALSEIVTAPATSASINPTTLTIKTGSTGTATVSVASVGGYTGTVTVACAPGLPTHVSCSYSPASLAFTGATNTLTSTVTINTSGNTAALHTTARPGSSTLHTILACTLLPFFGLFAFRRKRGGVHLRGLTLLLLLSLGAVAGLSGCAGSSNNNAAAGTYTIPVTLTASGANTTLNLSVTITN